MRRLVITAADSAFGMTVLKQLAEQGLDDFEWIYGTWYDAKEALDEVVSAFPQLQEKVILEQINMRDTQQITELCERIMEKGVPTDIVHLPAPKAFPMQFKKLSWDVFQDHMEISFRSAVWLLHALLPEMAKAKEGRIVLMSSYYGTEEGTPNFLAPYVSTKSAILGLMRALAKEYEPKKIKINAIAPDLTDTKFLDEMPEIMKETAAANSSRGRMLSADEVAEVLLQYLKEDLEETGRTVPIV